jgi:ornithine--oxo-acid transaminase
MEALAVVKDEHLAANAEKSGAIFRSRMRSLMNQNNLVREVRGKGLLNAIEINDDPESSTAWEICLKLRDAGLLAKPTHGNIIRFAPPLVITHDQLEESCEIIARTINKF